MRLADFIKAIEKNCHTQISMEALHPAFAECGDLKLPPELYLHHSVFCRNRKLADNNIECARNKKRSLEIASKGRSFFGKCPFGVCEFVQPVLFENKLACVCYFTVSEATLSIPELHKKARWLAEYILLELGAFARDGKKQQKQHDHEYYRKKILYFLDLHYMENIGENDLAGYLGMNPKYCSALFLKVMRKHFRTVLTERRLYEAKIYLKLHRDLNISVISRLCGFSDSNYFCSVFRRYCGITPKGFRNTKCRKE